MTKAVMLREQCPALQKLVTSLLLEDVTGFSAHQAEPSTGSRLFFRSTGLWVLWILGFKTHCGCPRRWEVISQQYK